MDRSGLRCSSNYQCYCNLYLLPQMGHCDMYNTENVQHLRENGGRTAGTSMDLPVLQQEKKKQPAKDAGRAWWKKSR